MFTIYWHFFVHLDEYDLNPDKAVLEGVRRMLERVEQCLMVNSVTDIKKCENWDLSSLPSGEKIINNFKKW